MNNFKVEKELQTYGHNKRNSEVPVFFSNGIDLVLSDLPNQTNIEKNQNSSKRKFRWLQVTAATGLLTAGIIGSGFASPAMAEVLGKVPGLNYIFSATYNDISEEETNIHKMNGSLYDFGENGPFNIEKPEVKMFSGYTKELKDYVGLSVPRLKNVDVHSIRVDKFSEDQFDIQTFAEIGNDAVVLNVVSNAVNSPSFQGASTEPIVKGSLDLEGIKADILAYRFSEKDSTNYIVWKRNDMTIILASTLTIDKLNDVAKDVDQQIR